MVRRRSLRSIPWYHRWSRPIIGAIAIAGAILTAYLTITKLSGGEVACNATNAENIAAGCNDVLNSPYATVFGLPLSLFGCLAYISMASFALSPLFVNAEMHKSRRKQLENITWLLLLAGGTAMAAFSGYLMYILATELQTVCYYCIGSALFSLGLLAFTIFGREWEEIGQLFFIPVIVVIITLVGTLGVYANVNQTANAPTIDEKGRIEIEEPTATPQPPYGWEVTTTSGENEISLAKHLQKIGARMYGAFWCPHCFEQKQLFGQEAIEIMPYVECHPEGKNPNPKACADAGIKSFPTWVINDKAYPGTQSLEKLTRLSGYQGTTDFKYFKSGLPES